MSEIIIGQDPLLKQLKDAATDGLNDNTPAGMQTVKRICDLIDAAYMEAFNRYCKVGLPKDTADLAQSMKDEPMTGKASGRFGLVETMRVPVGIYGRLRDMAPDKDPNWQKNKDFIKWLANQNGFEWLKAQPLAGRSAGEI